MKSSYIYLMVIGSLMFGAILGGVSVAQPAAPAGGTRVAVADVVQIFNDYERATDLSAQFQQRAEQIETQARQRDEGIQRQAQALAALDRNSAAYRTQQQQLAQMRFERDLWVRMQDELARQDYHELAQEMYGQILAEIDRHARASGIQIVIFREPRDVQADSTRELLARIGGRRLLYYDDQVDITGTILTRLNTAYRRTRG